MKRKRREDDAAAWMGCKFTTEIQEGKQEWDEFEAVLQDSHWMNSEEAVKERWTLRMKGAFLSLSRQGNQQRHKNKCEKNGSLSLDSRFSGSTKEDNFSHIPLNFIVYCYCDTDSSLDREWSDTWKTMEGRDVFHLLSSSPSKFLSLPWVGSNFCVWTKLGINFVHFVAQFPDSFLRVIVLLTSHLQG